MSLPLALQKILEARSTPKPQPEPPKEIEKTDRTIIWNDGHVVKIPFGQSKPSKCYRISPISK